MDNTPKLNLPYIAAAQAQKHVTHNEAIRALDALLQLSVKDRDLTAAPASPVDGDRYIVAAGATGAWAGKDAQVAAWQDGVWTFYPPQEGWVAWIEDEDALYAFDAAAWVLAGGGGGGSVNPTPLVGVNVTADTTNRLSVSSPATLFNHEGAGHQVKVNKNAVGDTASYLFQTGFSGRAEVGLTGDDDFHFKVSPDGTTFFEAIIIDKDDGRVSFPNTSITAIAPNQLINGDLQINQRGFAGGALTAGSYGFDRFKAAAGGANVSVSGFVVTLTSGELEQVVEPGVFGYSSFASLAVTVSVEAPSQDLTVTFGSQSGSITAGSGRRSVTLSLGAGDSGNLSFKIKRTAAGSVTFERVKLEVGGSVTSWQRRDAVTEFDLCQRYYQLNGATAFGIWSTSARASISYQLATVMRTAPTVTLSSPVLTIREIGIKDHDLTAATLDGVTAQDAGIFLEIGGASGAAIGNGAVLRNNVVALDAEL